MSHSAGVTIQSMRIHGNAEHKQAFLHSLDNQHWQGEDAEEIIFIKKIHVAGYWWELAEKIATQANESMKTQVVKNHSDDIVIFQSRADLVAQIIIQLLKGESSWYAKLWLKQESINETFISLLISRIVDLPEIFQRLIKHNALVDLMLSLSVEEIRQLIDEVNIFLAIDRSPVVIRNNFLPVKDPIFESKNSALWFSTYFLAIDKKPLNKNSATAVVELICLMGLWRWASHRLQSAEFRSLWQYQWLNQFQQFSVVQQITSRYSHRPETDAHTNPVNQTFQGSQTLKVGQSENTKQDLTQQFEDKNNFPLDSMEWLTDFGGVFFFINACRHHKNDLKQLAQSGQSPWIGIYHLAQSLAKIMSVELDISLRDIFCELTQLDSNQLEDFSRDIEIQLFIKSVIEDLEKKLRPLDLWNSELFIARAKVSLSSAHINIYFDQSWVRLAIRRAGLDVNPGWVPWLGRVIRFHYGNFPELAQTVRQL